MIVAAFLSSAMSLDKSLEVGKSAPKIETVDGTNVGIDANPNGQTKLISFWNPKKPDSRIANRNLSREYGENSDQNLEFISICTDSDKDLMYEVMKIDRVHADKAYAYSDIAPRVFKDYGVEESPKAFMISPDGKIIAIL